MNVRDKTMYNSIKDLSNGSGSTGVFASIFEACCCTAAKSGMKSRRIRASTAPSPDVGS